VTVEPDTPVAGDTDVSKTVSPAVKEMGGYSVPEAKLSALKIKSADQPPQKEEIGLRNTVTYVGSSLKWNVGSSTLNLHSNLKPTSMQECEPADSVVDKSHVTVVPASSLSFGRDSISPETETPDAVMLKVM